MNECMDELMYEWTCNEQHTHTHIQTHTKGKLKFITCFVYVFTF